MLGSPTDEIKAKLNITEVLSDYLELKKAGTNFKAVCPFHSEKTPSFMVSPQKQIWHCFGCGLGGDIFEFIKQAENVEFPEALKILADRAGVQLIKQSHEAVAANKRKNVLYEINNAASLYYQKVLWESPQAQEALKYLKDRGLTDQTISTWQLGFALDDFHAAENFLSKSFNKHDIVEAGMIIKKDSDSTYFDRFRDRIMFPIINLHGQTVGFTGRLLHDRPDAGKYINSPETPIYNKSREIYGLYQAKNKVRQENQAVLVEGNMDVIASHQAGMETAIASSGTALAETQLSILQRFCENLVFAFDADSAGLAAARRALELALNLGFNVKVANLQASKDPDELIKKGVGLWQKAVNRAENYIDFFFSKSFAQFGAETVEGKRAIVKELAPLVLQISDPITKAHFIRKLSNAIGVAETVIWDIINKLSRPRQAPKNKASLGRKTRREVLEDQVLGLTLNLGKTAELRNFDPQDFSDINRKLFSILSAGGNFDADRLRTEHPELAAQVDMLQFATGSQITEQNLRLEEEILRAAKELKKIVLKGQMERVAQALKSAEASKDRDLAKKLSVEFTNLSSQINQYNK